MMTSSAASSNSRGIRRAWFRPFRKSRARRVGPCRDRQQAHAKPMISGGRLSMQLRDSGPRPRPARRPQFAAGDRRLSGGAGHDGGPGAALLRHLRRRRDRQRHVRERDAGLHPRPAAAAEDALPGRIYVVVNWFEELKPSLRPELTRASVRAPAAPASCRRALNAGNNLGLRSPRLRCCVRDYRTSLRVEQDRLRRPGRPPFRLPLPDGRRGRLGRGILTPTGLGSPRAGVTAEGVSRLRRHDRRF